MRKIVGALGLVAAIATAPALAQSVSNGHILFEKWCADCHNPDPAKQTDPNGPLVGRVYAGTYTLQQRYKGAEPAPLEQRTDLNPGMIKFTVRHGLNMMPHTRKTEISDAELNDIAAYLTRNNR